MANHVTKKQCEVQFGFPCLQALSTALWSIAHVRHKDLKIDKDASWCDAATKFLYLAGSHCLQMLSGTSQASSGGGSSSSASSGARFHEDHLLYQVSARGVPQQ